MRITNKIMQRNNLSNITTNKVYQDKLSNEMATQKKINRPSDDPVVAIRALRLRSNVTEITQYYSKNIPDAESWLSVTEDALKNLSQITTNMITQCTKGANGDLTTSDRQIILEQLKALGEEVYSTGDADYAGRYVFTGYRTDTSLSFDREQTLNYSITEDVTSAAIDKITSVRMEDTAGNVIANRNAAQFLDANTINITEDNVKSVEVYRFRLAYDKCSDYSDRAGISPKIEFTAPDGTQVTWQGTDFQIMHDYEDPYSAASAESGALIYVPETGEILMGEDKYNELIQTRDDESTAENEAQIRITYEKSDWRKGDLRPEHYFYCRSNPDTDEETLFNENYLTSNAERQDIEYDVGFNQTIRVNSTADQCFKHGIGREVDDIVKAMEDVQELETIKTKLENEMNSYASDSTEYGNLKTKLDAINKALTYSKDKEQKLFEKGITSFQGYLDDASLCITECGTRSSKLELIKNRTQNQKTTFETLKSENEDIDITEVAIQLSSAELTYQAALMATGKVAQTTLLNYL